jgi:hypothetical protein
MTKAETKRLYLAGGVRLSPEDDWRSIRDEMQLIVDAKSAREAAEVIEFWNCWHDDDTALMFARKVRKAWREKP